MTALNVLQAGNKRDAKVLGIYKNTDGTHSAPPAGDEKPRFFEQYSLIGEDASEGIFVLSTFVFEAQFPDQWLEQKVVRGIFSSQHYARAFSLWSCGQLATSDQPARALLLWSSKENDISGEPFQVPSAANLRELFGLFTVSFTQGAHADLEDLSKVQIENMRRSQGSIETGWTLTIQGHLAQAQEVNFMLQRFEAP